MRIVSLLPSATEILFAIGAGDEVVAVTHECDYPEEARHLPAITSSAIDHAGHQCSEIDRHIKQALHEGSSIYRLDEAQLAELNPDLIITQELCQVCAVSYEVVGQAIRSFPGDVEVLSLEPTSVEDILGTIETVGVKTGHSQGAAELVPSLRGRLDRVRALPSLTPPPRVVCLEWTDPLMAGGHWVPEMVALAGGHDVLGVEHEPSRWIGAEEIEASKPDIVVLMPCGFSLADTVEVADQLLETGVPPWMSGARVVAVDGSSYFNRPGPRIVDGVELLSQIFRSPAGAPLPDGAQWIG